MNGPASHWSLPSHRTAATKETVVKLPIRHTAFTILMITGLTAAAASLAPVPAVSASAAPASAAPGTKLWSARFHGLGGFGGPAAIAASPNGSDVFVTGSTSAISGTSRYATVGYNALTGAKLWSAIFREGPKRATSDGGGVAVSPDGSTVYVTGTTPTGIGTVAYNAATGTRLWVKNFAGAASGSLAVSPDGATLFVTGSGFQGTGNFYVTLAYDIASGALLWTAKYNSGSLGIGGNFPQVAVSPDGSTVFILGESGLTFTTFAYNAATGAQRWAQFFSGLGQSNPAALAVSPDGSTVFVTGVSRAPGSMPLSYATVAYKAATGAQRWVQYDAGLSPSQVGRTSANSIAVKPDGTAVFVTGENTEANGTGGYSTIAYDAATGTKLWQQRYFANGTGGEAAQASFVGVSPDGSEVFVTGLTHRGHFATLGYDSSSGAQLWLALKRPVGCGTAFAAVNPASPEVMVTGSCTGANPQNQLTVAYTG
jgi:DNA-binding beta-propeller fold protein YncE